MKNNNDILENFDKKFLPFRENINSKIKEFEQDNQCKIIFTTDKNLIAWIDISSIKNKENNK